MEMYDLLSRRRWWSLAAFVPLLLAPGTGTAAAPRGPATGPLRVLKYNPRYFTDDSGRAIYLTGSHTWANLVDFGTTDPPAKFDFAAYLDWLVKLDHNFTRGWTWELVSWNTKSMYFPKGKIGSVDLSTAKGDFSADWIHPETGAVISGGKVAGGRKWDVAVPSKDSFEAAVVHLVKN